MEKDEQEALLLAQELDYYGHWCYIDDATKKWLASYGCCNYVGENESDEALR